MNLISPFQPSAPAAGPSSMPPAQNLSLPLETLQNNSPTSKSTNAELSHSEDGEKEHYQLYLQAARDAAAKDHGYSTLETRARMTNEIQVRCNGMTPHTWQLDVAEAVYLGLDTAVIAGTGQGKTLPFAMILLADESKTSKIIIISTLNELEQDQALRFNKMNLKAVAVNGETWRDVSKSVAANEYRIILTSPEMILKHEEFSKLVRDSEWMQDYACTIIDEAHCVVKWGKSFRKEFSEVERLRSFMAGTKPFLIASATLPPFLLDETLKKLDIRRNQMFFVNLGNDRRNITTLVCKMRGSANDLISLDFTVDEALRDCNLTRTIIYMNTRDLTAKGYLRLVDKVPDKYKPQIEFIHGRRSKRAKARVMRRFRIGDIKLLLATEVAGMGMDIPDIRRVVQFMVPDSLLTWYQHAGRAGRDGNHSVAILLVEKSVYERVKKRKRITKGKRRGKAAEESVDIKQEEFEPAYLLKRKHQDGDQEPVADQAHADQSTQADAHVEDPINDDEDDAGDEATEDAPFEYRKRVDPPLRRMIETQDCRRLEPRDYFKNPRIEHDDGDDFCCCDTCLEKLGHSSDSPLSDRALELLALKCQIETGKLPLDLRMDNSNDDNASDNSGDNISDEDEQDADDSQGLSKIPKKRYGEHKAKVSTALETWRHDYWEENYDDCAWGELTLLPQEYVKALSNNRRIFSVEDLKIFAPAWPFWKQLGQVVFDIITDIDLDWAKARAKQKAEKHAKSVANQAVRLEEHNRKRRKSGPENAPGIIFHTYNGTTQTFGAGAVHHGPFSQPLPQLGRPPLSQLPSAGFVPGILHPTQPLLGQNLHLPASPSSSRPGLSRAYVRSQPLDFMYSQHSPQLLPYSPPLSYPSAQSSHSASASPAPAPNGSSYFTWKL